jgi:hypothetical protein
MSKRPARPRRRLRRDETAAAIAALAAAIERLTQRLDERLIEVLVEQEFTIDAVNALAAEQQQARDLNQLRISPGVPGGIARGPVVQ